jgi:DNA-binding GntR family transcriptional regulator
MTTLRDAALPAEPMPDMNLSGMPGSGLVTFRWFGSRAPLTLSLPEQIAARIGDRIVFGTIAPGQRIVEQELAAEFQVSRGPVREALRILEREGLVRIHARRGASATALTGVEVRDMFEIRAGLYRIVAQRLAEACPPAAIALLAHGVPQLEALAEEADGGDRYAEVVFRLSLNVACEAGNAKLADMITSLALQTFRYSRLGLRSQERRRESARLWRQSLDAMRNGDVERACELAMHRIERSRDEALRVLGGPTAQEQRRGM